MKKYAILGLMLAMPLATAKTDVMKEAYKEYSESEMCYFATKETESGISQYCVSLYANEAVPNEAQEGHYKTYYLAVGDNFEKAHVLQGNIGLIIEDNGKGFESKVIAQELFIDAGSSGYAPTDYQFQKIGFNSYGFVAETGYMGQGVSQGGIMIVGDHNGKIFDSYIPTFYDDSSHYAGGDHEELSESIEGSYELIPNDQQKMYDIKVTLNGYYIGTEFKDQSFVMTFDEQMQQYNIPADYPLKAEF